MAKAYWVAIYRSTPNPEAHAAYVKLAVPALTAHGAHFLARGAPAQTYKAGLKERIVIVEFDSVADAIAAHDSRGYQAALKAFNNAAERDFRIVEGLA